MRPDEPIANRHELLLVTPDEVAELVTDVMEANGDAMKPLSAIAKNEAPFDPAVVQESGETILGRPERYSSCGKPIV